MVNTIEETILSVINQGYDNIEYIIIDGGSTDGTLKVIDKYKDRLSYFISEPDSGIYDALNKGFKMATGEVFGWINGDDILLENCLSNVSEAFKSDAVRWITGLNTIINEKSEITYQIMPYMLKQQDFLSSKYFWNKKMKAFGTIQQESTFFSRKLWEMYWNSIPLKSSYAGDFELWMRFFRTEKLNYVNKPLGAFRVRIGQLSQVNLNRYLDEVYNILNFELDILPVHIRCYYKIKRKLNLF